jgi:hypothetical protein
MDLTYVLKNIKVVTLSISIGSSQNKTNGSGCEKLESKYTDHVDLNSPYHPKNITKLSSIKTDITTYLDEIGVNFLNGWAIPTSSVEIVDDMLMRSKIMFNSFISDKIGKDFEKAQNYVMLNPGILNIIDTSKDKSYKILTDFRFNYYFCEIINNRNEYRACSIQSEIASIGPKLFDELKNNNDLITLSLVRNIPTYISHIFKKFESFYFVDPTVKKMADILDTLLQICFYNTKKRKDDDLKLLEAILKILKKPNLYMSMKRYNDLNDEVKSTDSVQQDIISNKFLDSLGLW